MADSGISKINPTVSPQNRNLSRTGGGKREPVARGGKTSDPADIVSLTSETTSQQRTNAPAQDVQAPQEGQETGGIGTPSSQGIGQFEVGIRGKGKTIDVFS